ncbi:hypothetical protein B0186_11225 [Canicola haemoglobinophilus]|uniref:Uncharacterized protein n=1 Tax=Canicola haemoglobinophilus TaxID=733 RepID=A0A1V4AYB7_9PAST|nr:hypothetical protein [Canicola haemoglobinophilus]OOR95814.1 hypothetical protein B0186_11225 [Canicola haemoglobinophilus]STO59549.1 Uncharacterised protein [Canicola haemoglobinophilus]
MLNPEEKRAINENIAYCIEQLEEAQKYLRDGDINASHIFVANSFKRLQNVKLKLQIGGNQK